MDCEIQYRLKCAGAAFGCLRIRSFQDRDIWTITKMLVYKAVIVPTLLYGSETWVTYRRHLNQLERFHQSCLRSILKIKWEEYRTNNLSVSEEAKISSIEATIIKSRLQWTGHMLRMDNSRLPKQLLYGQLKNGKRVRG
ncbi:uncharacterized protein LOC143236529 [Tachypleus tridentatus]|uniref:uncharacterized protein LOC143236529 n=1 Tax=Tachypleus tridentatus TaxID=6853 RepID=UPI003FCFE7C5